MRIFTRRHREVSASNLRALFLTAERHRWEAKLLVPLAGQFDQVDEETLMIMMIVGAVESLTAQIDRRWRPVGENLVIGDILTLHGGLAAQPAGLAFDTVQYSLVMPVVFVRRVFWRRKAG